jgi:hypothetical protein
MTDNQAKYQDKFNVALTIASKMEEGDEKKAEFNNLAYFTLNLEKF